MSTRGNVTLKFGSPFGKLTAACSSCHEAADLGFIKIRDP